MRRTMVLVWKEWREQQWFLYGGLATFLVFPLMEILYKLRKGYTVWTETPEWIVLSLGGLLAIIVGVGAACRDLTPRLQSFWQSRPVGLSRWLAVKYVVGLGIVLLVCLLPLLLQWWVEAHRPNRGGPYNWMPAPAGPPGHGFPQALIGVVSPFLAGVLACHTFTIVLIFSVAFFMGCLVRRAAQAAVLALAVALFVYFLPTLFPPLAGFGVFNVMENIFWDRRPEAIDSQYKGFVAAMLAGSGFALLLSNLALRRDWRLQVDKKVVIATLGVIFLVLGSVSAFQVGTNLTCAQSIEINPPNRPAGSSRCVSRIVTSGGRGVLVLNNRPPGYIPVDVSLTLCGFDLSAAGTSLGDEIPLKAIEGYQGIGRARGLGGAMVWSDTRPNRVYFLSTTEKKTSYGTHRGDPVLMTVATDAPGDRAVIHRLDLSSYGDGSQICGYRGRICFLCSESWDEPPRIVVIDVSQPDAPRVAEVLDSPGRFGVRSKGNAYQADFEVTGVALPRIEGLSGQERLDLALRLTLDWADPPMAFSDGVLVAADGGGLSTFRLTGIEDDLAGFERVGRYRRSLLEEALMRQGYRVVLSKGLAYVLDRHGLTVYDVRRPEYPRRVGHYASAEDWFGDVVPLPDGRILVGGAKLHVLAAPKAD